MSDANWEATPTMDRVMASLAEARGQMRVALRDFIEKHSGLTSQELVTLTMLTELISQADDLYSQAVRIAKDTRIA